MRDGWTQDDLEDYEERAAIIEYMGGSPRAAAEKLAEKLINRQVALRLASRSAEGESHPEPSASGQLAIAGQGPQRPEPAPSTGGRQP